MAQDKETTKGCIFTALTLLMEQKEYKYITVTDIARKSGVSRITYYRTYSSKEDILVQHFQKVAQQMVAEAQGNEETALCIFFKWFQEHRKLTELLEQAHLLNLLVACFSVFTDFLYEAIHSEEEVQPDARYAARFEAGGLFSLLMHALAEGAEESPEEMAQITLKIMKK
ncbi:MAG: TetR family transcriptional regulator C-terminal domain-containing protein [Clostridiales bacterium]|nr:TetR family transcriptional regulator C-terminal domain-containing protein [Clostridiales bacterium]